MISPFNKNLEGFVIRNESIMSNHEKRQSQKNLSRRSFIGTVSAATAAFTLVPRHVLGGNGYTSPSDMVNVAGIGVGARGGSDIRGICDPYLRVIQKPRSIWIGVRCLKRKSRLMRSL